MPDAPFNRKAAKALLDAFDRALKDKDWKAIAGLAHPEMRTEVGKYYRSLTDARYRLSKPAQTPPATTSPPSTSGRYGCSTA